MQKILALIIGLGAGLIGYSIYTNSSSILNAAVIITFIAILASATSTWGAVWNSITLLQQPYIIALIGLGIGYYVFSMSGYSFYPTSSLALGLAMIGFALGTIIYAYWNIA